MLFERNDFNQFHYTMLMLAGVGRCINEFSIRVFSRANITATEKWIETAVELQQSFIFYQCNKLQVG